MGAKALQKTGVQYNEAVDQVLSDTLFNLDVRQADEAKLAFDQVEGSKGWWRKDLHVGEDHRILRKNFEYGREIHPWTVPTTPEFCEMSESKVSLEIPEFSESGEKLTQFYSLVFYVDLNQIDQDFIFPHEDKPSLIINGKEIPLIVEKIKQKAIRNFGPLYTKPVLLP